MTAEDPLVAPLRAFDDALADGLLFTDDDAPALTFTGTVVVDDERSGGPLPHGGSPHDAFELLAAAGPARAIRAARART